MGLFDFFKPRNKGIENSRFYSTQFQNEICALALWKLEQNNQDPGIAIGELKKYGLNEEQTDYILAKTRDLLSNAHTHNQQTTGITVNEFFDEKYQTEILAYAQEAYFQNNHNYNTVKQNLLEKGLSGNQANNILSKLKKLNTDMVDDFTGKLDSGEISGVKIYPNPEHRKGAVNTDQVDRYIGYGAYQMERDDLDNALELFDKALELDDRAPLAYANKGSLYARKGDNEKALHFYNKALEFEPKNLLILENKMDILLEMMSVSGEHEFIETVKTILQIDEDYPNALIYIIQYYNKNNDLENALKSVKKLFAAHHSESIAIKLLLDVFNKFPEDQALHEFATFKADLSRDAKYQLEYCKGLYLKKIGKYTEATRVFEGLNKLEPFSWSYYQMAIMKNLQHKTDEALQLLETTFNLEPGLKSDAKEYPELQNLWANAKFIELTK